MQADVEQYRIAKEPFYQPQGDETSLYEAAYAATASATIAEAA